MSEIKSTYKALDPVQQSLVQDRRLSQSGTVDDWLELLGPVAAFEQQCDALVKGHGHLFERRFARKHKLPDVFLEIADTLLPVLRADHDPQVPLELTIDLTGQEQKAKQVGESKPYQQGAYNRIVDTFYADRWLQGHAEFVDGADVHFSLTTNVRMSNKRKRSAMSTPCQPWSAPK